MHDKRWPNDFMNVAGKTFRWTYLNRKEFVDFTLRDMREPTGLFQIWKAYCKAQKKFEDENKK